MPAPEFFDHFLKALAEINAPLSLERTAESVVNSVTRLYKAKGATVFLYNPSNDTLQITASCGLSQAYLEKGPVSASMSLKEAVLGEPVVVDDVARSPHVQYPEEALKEGIKCIIGMPLSAGRLSVGALRLYFAETRLLEPREMEALKGLATQAGLALRKNIFFSALKEFGSDVHSAHSLYSFKDTMNKLVKVAAKSAQSKASALYLLNRETNTLEALSTYGLSAPYVTKGPVTVNRSIGEVIHGQPVVITDTATDPRVQYPAQAAEENIKSIIGFPIKVGHKTVGSLRFYYPLVFEPDQDDLAWMQHLADQTSLALERNQLLIQLKASHDHYIDLMEDLDARYYR
ncbi:MAG: GAF domain-containing protein [Thermodesulfobacteriota bacterium]